ncbi:MAG: hypothetical protein IJS19_06430 [Muribaculaceae bacterium]|nr:hypothetical protein [Muribaculaceae bacterium]
MEGWIKLHRKFLEWEWFDSDNMVKMFIYLLLSANTKDKRWRGMIVKRGQLVTSRASLSERLNISERSVRTCIARLVDGGEITTKSTNKFTILTICKYEQYQQVKNDSRPTNDQQTTNKRPTNDQQTTTTKESKESRESRESKEEYINDINSARTHEKNKISPDDFVARVTDPSNFLVEQFCMSEHITVAQFKEYAKAAVTEWLLVNGEKEIEDNGDTRKHLLSHIRIKHQSDLRSAKKQTDKRLGVDERIEADGRRTYGTGKATVPADAPPRPSKYHRWIPSLHCWDDNPI